MIFKTEFYADAKPGEVFETFHRYKISRDPQRFFPSKVVKWRFEVLSDHVLGLDAVYEWKIWLLGIPVLDFKEQESLQELEDCAFYSGSVPTPTAY